MFLLMILFFYVGAVVLAVFGKMNSQAVQLLVYAITAEIYPTLARLFSHDSLYNKNIKTRCKKLAPTFTISDQQDEFIMIKCLYKNLTRNCISNTCKHLNVFLQGNRHEPGIDVGESRILNFSANNPASVHDTVGYSGENFKHENIQISIFLLGLVKHQRIRFKNQVKCLVQQHSYKRYCCKNDIRQILRLILDLI